MIIYWSYLFCQASLYQGISLKLCDNNSIRHACAKDVPNWPALILMRYAYVITFQFRSNFCLQLWLTNSTKPPRYRFPLLRFNCFLTVLHRKNWQRSLSRNKLKRESIHPFTNSRVCAGTSTCQYSWRILISNWFPRCVTGTPSTSFSRGEVNCIANCVERFLDTSLFVVKKIEEQRQQFNS